MGKQRYSISPLKNLSPAPRLVLSFLPMILIFLLSPYLPMMYQTPAIYLYPAVFLATWLGGSLAGFISPILCLIFAIVVIKPHLLESPLADLPNLIRSNVFLWTSYLFVTLVMLLERTLRRAEEAISLRDEFISVASHELKTPLTATKLHLEVLKKMLGSDAVKVQNVLSSLERQSIRQDKIIGNIVDVTLIEAGQLSSEKQLIDLKKFVERGADSAIYTYNRGTLNLDCENVSAFADGKRIEQLIFNLVHNALKYGNASPVQVRLFQKEKDAVIEVRNKGSVISAVRLKKFSEKYGKPRTNSDIQGLGTGIYIANHITDIHDGTLTFSGSGDEIIVTVTIPIN